MFSQAYEDDLAILPDSVRKNAESLPELLAESRASSTTKGYYRSYKKWKEWLKGTGVQNNEANVKPLVVATYLVELIQGGASKNVLSSAFYKGGICISISVV